MALPSAQLGQMSTLNAPSSVGLQVVRKEPKAWQTALMAILENAASSVASHGVQNYMSKDYATQNGQKDSSGFNKFWNGPQVTQQQNEQLSAQKAAATQAGLDRELHQKALDQQYLNSLNSQELERQRNQQQGQYQTGSLEQQAASLDAEKRHQAAMEYLAQLTSDRQLPGQQAQVGDINSQIALRTAEAQKAQLANQIMQKALGGGQTQQGINPDVKNFVAPPSPRQQAVQQRLQNTSKYPTADMYMQKIQNSGQVAPGGVQTSPDTTPNIQPAPVLPPEIQAIMDHIKTQPYTVKQPEIDTATQYLRDKQTGGATDPNDPNVVLQNLISGMSQ